MTITVPRTRSMRSAMKGVSLLELMIVVVVIALLATMGFPAYRQYAQRADRTDAKAALMRIASAQERFFLQNNTYTVDLMALGVPNTDHGYYNLGLVAGPGGIGNSYVATATAAAGSGQFADTDCRTFRMTETGMATSTDAGGGDTSTECW